METDNSQSSTVTSAPHNAVGVQETASSPVFWRRLALGLPAKLLLLTVAFVMLAEVLIFVPSVANFRKNWLMQRIVAAKIASLALEASHGVELPERLSMDLLNSAGVHAVSLRRRNFRQLVLGMPADHAVADVYDLRQQHFWALVRDGLSAFTAPPGRLIRVIGSPDMMPDDEIDIVIDETPLRAALWGFADNIFWLSLLISAFTAALVYLALTALLVRPMMMLTKNMVAYRENPEDLSRIIVPSGRGDEIGIAETELGALQTELSGFLKEKARLANIGLAVSKISHDLRNMLASAQLLSDRLAAISDPTVQRFAPRLIRALDRAIALCVDTLKYGKSEEAPPHRTRFPLRPLIVEVTESLGSPALENVRLILSVSGDLSLWADRDQIFRVFSNLLRNTLDAFKAEDHNPAHAKSIHISAEDDAQTVTLRISDNGPGVPPMVRDNLFKAFQSQSRGEGTGLGLAICAELVQAHGGQIALADTQSGATFIIMLPNAAPDTRRPQAVIRPDGMLAHERFRR